MIPDDEVQESKQQLKEIQEENEENNPFKKWRLELTFNLEDIPLLIEELEELEG